MKVLCIVQARMNSSRLPGKVLKKIGNKSLIQVLYERLTNSKLISHIVFAITNDKTDDRLEEKLKTYGADVFRGSENDVLKRFYSAARIYKPDNVMRITGDCPLVDSELIDDLIKHYYNNKCDYISNINPPTYPDGLDIELFPMKILKKAHKNASTKNEREHVTIWIRKNKYLKKINFENEYDFSQERWTVDEHEDLLLIRNIFYHFDNNIDFSWKQILDLRKIKPKIFEVNKKLKRNEGSDMATGQKLYKHAKNIIPGGTMLLSKRPEMFLPDNWPSYYKKAKGCKIWDLDGNEFLDMSIMGVGTNILGYSNQNIDEAVIKALELGNMSSLNCREEVDLADKLIELHPWAGMARFCRSGGEANAVAIRIARAATNKDKVAICGYHGWHDWYLSSNISNENGLNNHLLPGLNPSGVPKALKNTVIPFNYNDINQISEIIDKNPDLGTIKMEVSRNYGPLPGYLEKIRELCDKNDIVLIFDECTSGFRQTFGGLHKKYKIEPDMAMFGKALGNGYAITAVIGKSEIMNAAQKTFISSTFWTERIGPTAALKTLEIMETEKSWDKITEIGLNVTKKWKQLALKYGIEIKTSGLPSLTSFYIDTKHWNGLKTFITQEMLKKNILATNSIYVSIAHKKEYLENYFYELEKIFARIANFKNLEDVYKNLDGPICHSGFKRLN